MQYWIPGTLVATLLLSGCSILGLEKPEQVVDEQRVAELQIPQGLIAPRKPAQFDLPAQVAPGEKGEALDLRPPVQILAVATNSSVDEEDKNVRVWFERSEYTGELLPYLQSNIVKFMQENDIALESQKDLEFKTGLVNQYEETGFWFWKGQELAQQGQFLVTLEPKTHGRTIGVSVHLASLKYQDPERKLTTVGQRREEAHFLNRLIDHIATVELAAIREAKAKVPDVQLTRATSGGGDAVLLTKLPLDNAWSQVEVLFQAVSLEVTDLNRNDYIYFVKFTKPESGFWDAIWGGSKAPELPLAEQEYQVKLSRAEQGTIIQFSDAQGKALSAETVDAIFPVLVETIRQNKIEL